MEDVNANLIKVEGQINSKLELEQLTVPSEQHEFVEESMELNPHPVNHVLRYFSQLETLFKNELNDHDSIVKVIGCQINVRRNGELEVHVPDNPELSQKLQNVIKSYLNQINSNLNDRDQVLNVKLFHLSTLEELNVLEFQLKNRSVRNRLSDDIVKFQRHGRTGQDCLRKMLEHLITDDLTLEFNWAGRDGKKSFKNLHLTTLLIDSILTSYPKLTAYSLEKFIKQWLKQAQNRISNICHD